MRSVGEVEVRALADDCLARLPCKTRVAADVVGYADLTLVDRVEPVLAALAQVGGGRFRGVRNSAGFHQDPVIGKQSPWRDCWSLPPQGFPGRSQRAHPDGLRP